MKYVLVETATILLPSGFEDVYTENLYINFPERLRENEYGVGGFEKSGKPSISINRNMTGSTTTLIGGGTEKYTVSAEVQKVSLGHKITYSVWEIIRA